MKKILIAVSALALAGAMSSAQAAPAKSPYCNMAASQKNLVGWNAYYHCLSPAAAPRLAHHAAMRTPARPAKDPYCKMASTQKNLVSWNAYYHCL